MPLPTQPVTCRFYDQSGTPVAGARATFRLTSTEVYDGIVAPELVEATADATGQCVVNLFPNALGTNASQYIVKAWNPDTGGKFLDVLAAVPNSPCLLHQIMVQEPYPPVDQAAAAMLAAQSALSLVTAQRLLAEGAASGAAASEAAAENAADAAAASALAAQTSGSAIALAGDLSSTASGKGGWLVRFIRNAVGAVGRWVSDKLSDTVNVKDFGAVCDGVTNDAAAINAAVLHLATLGRGRLQWPAGLQCRVDSPIWLVSKIHYDLNGSELIGAGATTGTMFETAYLSGGSLITTVGTPYESHVTKFAKISDGTITNVGKAFNFQNANMGCKIADVEVYNALQFGVFDACFYLHLDTCMHSGGTVSATPGLHFKSANNAIKLNKVTTTAEWPYHFEGGGTAVTMTGCTQEGCSKGIKITGDLLGLTITGNYAEAIPGTWLDLTAAGIVTFDIGGNYFNYVDIVLDDGGPSSNALIMGRWAESNQIVNINGVDGGFTYRARMQVSGRLNVVEYELNNNNDGSVTVPAHWITGANTNISFCSTFLATSTTDYRKKALCGTGLIPLRFSGDTGAVYTGTVPFCTVTLGATTTIDTAIKWQPHSLFAKFSFNASDGNGNHGVYGDIYGTVFKRHDSDAMVMAISDNSGFLRISLTQTAPPFASVTGTVQICS